MEATFRRDSNLEGAVVVITISYNINAACELCSCLYEPMSSHAEWRREVVLALH